MIRNDDKPDGVRRLAMPVYIPELTVKTFVKIVAAPSGRLLVLVEQKSISPGVTFSYPHEVSFGSPEAVDYVIEKLQRARERLASGDPNSIDPSPASSSSSEDPNE